MGIGEAAVEAARETARAACEKAVEVYAGLVRLAVLVEQIQTAQTEFRDDTRKRLTDFERRMENRSIAAETRADGKSEATERRFQELETRIAQLEGKAKGTLEAYSMILRKYLRKRVVPGLLDGGDGQAASSDKEPRSA